MSAPIQLSPEMVDAYDAAKANGGRLIRHAGGFWCGAAGLAGRTFGTTTAQALVKRGAAYYSANHTRADRSSFPTELTINPLPQ
jgi:hypothetical protein